MKRRPRILVEAYECSPCKGHAAGGAWHIVSSLSKWFDLWVVTEETQYKQDIIAFFNNNSETKSHLRFFFIPRCYSQHRHEARPVLPIRNIWEYRKWLKSSYFLARRLHAEIGFDITHHLRGNSFREPGFLWKLPVPFVWGPTGGTTIVPWCMITSLDLKGQFNHAARNIMNTLQFRFSLRVRKASQRSAYILVQTTRDQENFRKVHSIQAVVAHEQATEPSTFHPRSYDGLRKLNIAWIGRFIALKGMPILLKAMTKPELRGRVVLHIAGDGPYRHKWRRMVNDLGISEQCIWYGWLPQKKVLDMLNTCDVLVFTSLLEGTPATVMQSFSLGIPVICLKHCGFGDVIEEDCGIAIPFRSYRSAIDGFSSAIGSLIIEPERVRKMSEGAYERSHRYSWDHLAKQVMESYEVALSCSDRRKA